MLKPMEIIARQWFGEWVYKICSGVYLPHLHNVFGNMLPDKMIGKRHSFVVQDATSIFCVQHHIHVFHK